MTPIVNILQGDLDTRDYLHTMLAISKACKVLSLSLVGYHREKLGRQTRCILGSDARYWVWETGSYTIYVSNSQGVAFEVPEASTKESAVVAWELYKEAMGV